MEINLKEEIGQFLVTWDQGRRIDNEIFCYFFIEQYIEEKIIIDFADVKCIAHIFLRAFLHTYIKKFGEEFVKNKIVFKNTTDQHEDVIDVVFSYYKKYMEDEAYRDFLNSSILHMYDLENSSIECVNPFHIMLDYIYDLEKKLEKYEN